MPAPVEVVGAFQAAVAQQDKAAARACSTAAGWSPDGDSTVKLAAQLSRGLRLQPVSQTIQGDRAALVVLVIRNADNQPAGDLFVLLRDEGGWKIDGATKSRALVGLFLQGKLAAAVATAEALPTSDDGTRWGALTVAQLRTGETGWRTVLPAGPDAARVADELATLAKGDGVLASLVGAHEFGSRLAVGFRFQKVPGDQREDRWVFLDRSGADGALVFSSMSRGPSLEAMMMGVEVPWAATPLAKE